MANHRTQKQTHYLRKFRPHGGVSARNILSKPQSARRTGIVFASIAATAGISAVTLALQHGTTLSQQSLKASTHTSSATVPSSTSNTSVTITPTAPASPDAGTSIPNTDNSNQISGQAVINNEVIPLTEGTVERSYTSENGAQNTVTITVDGSSTSEDSSRSRTSVHIDSDSNLSTDINTTRGSPGP